MENETKHSMRLALLLTFMVVALVVISIDQFRSDNGTNQQASVLHVYAK